MKNRSKQKQENTETIDRKQKPMAREFSGAKANGNERKGKKSRLPKAEKT